MMRVDSHHRGAGIAGALALLALAGCGGVQGRREAAGDAADRPAGAAATSPATSPSACSRRCRAPHGERGRDLVDGAKMAIADLNVRGGVNGHKAALVTYDDGCDAKTGARAARWRSRQSEVAGAVGGICASAAGAAARTLGSGLPFLVTSANAPSIVSARRTPTAYLINGTPYQSALATRALARLRSARRSSRW